MFLKNEDVKIGTIPDANGSDNPLKKMEFLTEKEMKDTRGKLAETFLRGTFLVEKERAFFCGKLFYNPEK